MIGKLLKEIPLLRMWADAVEKHALGLLLNNESVPGFKLVAGRTNRQWTNEDSASAWLITNTSLEEAMPRELVSPAQAEKLLRAHGNKNVGVLVAQYATKKAGAPTIAPVVDPRPEVSPFSEFEPDDLLT